MVVRYRSEWRGIPSHLIEQILSRVKRLCPVIPAGLPWSLEAAEGSRLAGRRTRQAMRFSQTSTRKKKLAGGLITDAGRKKGSQWVGNIAAALVEAT